VRPRNNTPLPASIGNDGGYVGEQAREGRGLEEIGFKGQDRPTQTEDDGSPKTGRIRQAWVGFEGRAWP
jgi:hypothetical protein